MSSAGAMPITCAVFCSQSQIALVLSAGLGLPSISDIESINHDTNYKPVELQDWFITAQSSISHIENFIIRE